MGLFVCKCTKIIATDISFISFFIGISFLFATFAVGSLWTRLIICSISLPNYHLQGDSKSISTQHGACAYRRRLLRSCIEAVVGLAEIWLRSALFYTTKYINMRRLIITLTFMYFVSVSAQDLIIKRNGDSIVCRIIETGRTEVVFKRWNNLEGDRYNMNIADVSSIQYEGNDKITINYEEEKASHKKQRREKMSKGKLAGLICGTTLGGPLVAAIVARIIAGINWSK